MPLTVVCGPMYAEKSSTLYRYVSRAIRSRKTVTVFVPMTDTRGNGQVLTHSGLSLESLGITPHKVSSSGQLWSMVQAMTRPMTRPPDLLVIDEAQFFDLDLPMWVGKLQLTGLKIVAAGLDLTSEGVPFGPMGALMCLADRVDKLTAICHCGAEATRTACKVKKTGDVLVGGAGEYVPMCLPCWKNRGNDA